MARLNRLEKCDFSEYADTLKVLGHPVRLKIICTLLSGDCDVGTLWKCLKIPQATVSHHLSLLRNKGLVSAKRTGKNVKYAVADEFTEKIIQFVDKNI